MTEENRYMGIFEFYGKEEVTKEDLDLIKFTNEKRKIEYEEYKKKKAIQLTQKQDSSDEPEQIICGQGRIL